MTLSELIEALQDLHAQIIHKTNDVEVNPEVRIAFQPNYPLAADVDAITAITGEADCGRDGTVVWIAAASSIGHSENPYAPKQAWDGDEVDLTDED